MAEQIYPNRGAIATLVDQMHQRWPQSSRNGYPCVPAANEEDIADFISWTVAELIESYIDAGSEREAMHENLYDHILKEVSGWTELDT